MKAFLFFIITFSFGFSWGNTIHVLFGQEINALKTELKDYSKEDLTKRKELQFLLYDNRVIEKTGGSYVSSSEVVSVKKFLASDLEFKNLKREPGDCGVTANWEKSAKLVSRLKKSPPVELAGGNIQRSIYFGIEIPLDYTEELTEKEVSKAKSFAKSNKAKFQKAFVKGDKKLWIFEKVYEDSEFIITFDIWEKTGDKPPKLVQKVEHVVSCP